MTVWILGFDLSLSAPGAAAVPIDWRPGDWKRVRTWLDKPDEVKNDDRVGQMQRVLRIADWAEQIVHELGARNVHAYREDYGYNQNNAFASRIMESGGHVQAALFKRFKLVVEPVRAVSARKLFYGERKLQQKDQKTHVQLALFNEVKAPKKWDENEADAFIIANWGLSERSGKFLILKR